MAPGVDNLAPDKDVSGNLEYQARIMGTAVEVLGRKWALLIIRDVAFLGIRTFNAIERNNPGLTSRMLARRLNELCGEGILRRVEGDDGPRYEATAKGEDALWILFAFLRYGLRHHKDAI